MIIREVESSVTMYSSYNPCVEPWFTLLKLPVTVLSGNLQPEEAFQEPKRWWGSTVRGALGSALRFLLCGCRGGSHKESCPFGQLFAPEGDGEQGPRYEPPPWLLRVLPRENGALEVELRLFGQATQWEEAFSLALSLAAFRGLGKSRFRWNLEARAATFLESWPFPAWEEQLALELVSPLRLQWQGELVTGAPSFLQLFVACSRRVRLCAKAFARVALPPPSSDQLAQARRVPLVAAETSWFEFVRYSRRQEQAMRLGGVVGVVRYGGDWRWAWPWLRFAPLFGIGKLITMGFGEVRWRNSRLV